MNNVSTSDSRRSRVMRLVRLALLAVALVVAIRAYNDKQVAGMALAALLALVAFFRIGDLSRDLPTPPLRQTLLAAKDLIAGHPVQALGGLALLFAAAGALLALGAPIGWVPVALWGFGILTMIAAAFLSDTRTDAVKLPAVMRRALTQRAILLEIGAVALISLVALFLRVYDNAHIPANMHGDEAESAWRGLRILIGPEPLPPFITSYDWYQLPTLYHYIDAFFMAIFGKNEIGMRWSAAAFGAGTIPVLYVFARLGWGRIAGFGSALLLTASHTHIQYSRMGGGFIHPSLMMAATALLIIIAARGGRRMLVFVGMGLVMGLAQYMYASARLLPVVAAPLLLILWRRKLIDFRHILVTGLAAAISLAPLLAWYAANPSTFGGRMDEVFILTNSSIRHTLGADATLAKDFGRLAALQFERIFGYFTNKGDAGGKYLINFPGFDATTVVLMWLGIALAFTRTRRFAEQTVLVWFGLGVLIGGLLTIDAPSGNRLLAAMPPVFVFGGIALQRLVDGMGALAGSFAARTKQAVVALAGTAVIGLVTALVFPQNLNTVFVEAPKVAENMLPILAGRELAPYDGKDWKAYAITLPGMYGNYAPVKFLAYKIVADTIQRADEAVPATDGRGTIIIASSNNETEYQKVKARLPGGVEHIQLDQRGNLVFKSYRIEGQR